MQWVYIAIGGALGTVLRFFVQGRIQSIMPGLFPIGTLGVNLIASAIIGFLGGCFTPGAASAGTHQFRLFLVVGILGGFSTFSSYAMENLYMLRDGQGRLAMLYIVASNTLGIALAFAGFFLARALIRSGAVL
jgi:CrcB protein